MSNSQLKKIVLLYNVKMNELRSVTGGRLDKQKQAMAYALENLNK